jgi:hypothetical protein
VCASASPTREGLVAFSWQPPGRQKRIPFPLKCPSDPGMLCVSVLPLCALGICLSELSSSVMPMPDVLPSLLWSKINIKLFMYQVFKMSQMFKKYLLLSCSPTTLVNEPRHSGHGYLVVFWCCPGGSHSCNVPCPITQRYARVDRFI